MLNELMCPLKPDADYLKINKAGCEIAKMFIRLPPSLGFFLDYCKTHLVEVAFE